MTDACASCGFLASDYTDHDFQTAPRWLASMAAATVEGVTQEALEGGAVKDALLMIDAAVSKACLDEANETRHEAVHTGVHQLRNLSRALHAAGEGVPTQQGTVAQINTSDGGVPKSAVSSVEVGARGIVGDHQAKRKHHGRPFQALCLWSTEVIDQLATEGHRIAPGLAGENITISGIDWTQVRPGARVLIGSVTAELSAWSTPCRNNDQWFTGRSDRIDHSSNPGWSRIYAWVIEGGSVNVGDTVVIEA